MTDSPASAPDSGPGVFAANGLRKRFKKTTVAMGMKRISKF